MGIPICEKISINANCIKFYPLPGSTQRKVYFGFQNQELPLKAHNLKYVNKNCLK